MLNRFLYLGYYFKKLDRPLFFKFLNHISQKEAISKSRLVSDTIQSVFKYNISLLEYYQFHFYQKDKQERRKWAGTGTLYEYQKIMNPPDKRHILDDKVLFKEKYKDFLVSTPFSVEELQQPKNLEKLKTHQQIVLKESLGKCGLGTRFIKNDSPETENLAAFMQREGYDLAEPYIQQHSDLQRLSPSGVNTIRIITQLDAQDEVVILGCRQRISVDSPVDNLAAGNLVAPIDLETGVISGPAVYSDITKPTQATHPITGVGIVGFQVPFWDECLDLAIKAALLHPENRSVGWDIVVTENGPGLIEGNHDWCKLVWQLPVGEGLKPVLERFLGTRD